jgi:RNA polymerase sigma-70 factor (ECF subfamily)
MGEPSTIQLQGLIERLHAGDPSARNELIARACDRLRRLTHKMLQDFPRVKRWEDTDDVLQNAALRLMKALETLTPGSVADFFRLAALQIRRELIDLARHYYGPEGAGAKHATKVDDGSAGSTPPPHEDKAVTTWEAQRLAFWQEFHERVNSLPVKERETFSLVWYHGLTQAEAAAVLNVSTPTIKNWWLSARLLLQDALKGLPPDD